MKLQKKHWTGESVADFQFRVGSDFVMQIEAKLDATGLTQAKFADRLSISKSRVSQIINDPGNLTLGSMIKWGQALGLKISIVAYDDDDAANEKGPIHAEIFQKCWNICGKPHDLWDMGQSDESSIILTKEELRVTRQHRKIELSTEEVRISDSSWTGKVILGKELAA